MFVTLYNTAHQHALMKSWLLFTPSLMWAQLATKNPTDTRDVKPLQESVIGHFSVVQLLHHKMVHTSCGVLLHVCIGEFPTLLPWPMCEPNWLKGVPGARLGEHRLFFDLI